MSVEPSAWAWRHSRAKGAALLVLLALADSADSDGTNAWPSIGALARKVRMSERTVQRHIRHLEKDLGEVRVIPNGGGRPGMRPEVRPNRYDVLMPPGANLTGDGVTAGAPPGDSQRANPVSPVTPKTSLETSRDVQPLRPASSTPGEPASSAHIAPEKTPLGRAILDALKYDPSRITRASRADLKRTIAALDEAGATDDQIPDAVSEIRRRKFRYKSPIRALADHWDEIPHGAERQDDGWGRVTSEAAV